MALDVTSQPDGQAAILENHPLALGSSHNIRLIRLGCNADTENQSSVITASVHVATLGETGSYIALSYVWGTDEPSNTILLDGKPMRVRDNLWSFLDAFSSEGNSSYLWIDAVCINQSSIPERNHQVTMMGRIYAGATKVIAWLGAAPSLVAAARVMMSQYTSLVWGTEIVQATYWRRVWIVQEFVLAKKIEIRCGAVTITTEMMDTIVWRYSSVRFQDSCRNERSRKYILLKLRHDQLNGIRPRDFMAIARAVYVTQDRPQCADSRDQVYSLLSLMNQETLQKYPIAVDYGISPFQLFEILVARHDRMESEDWLKTGSSTATLDWLLKYQICQGHEDRPKLVKVRDWPDGF